MQYVRIRRILLALAALCGGRAAAQPGPAVAPPVAVAAADDAVETPAEALEADAAEYARTYQIEPFEALRRLQAQEASVALIDRLADSYRNRLAGIVIEHRPAYQIVITTTDPLAADRRIATAPFGVPIILRTGARTTRAQALDAIAAHQAEIRAALPSPPGMGVDPATGALMVVVKANEIDKQGGTAALEAKLAAIAGLPVEVRSWGDVDADLSAEGGGRIVGGDSNVGRGVCTSGFVVTDGAQTALATAAHCPDELSYVDRDGKQTPLTMIGAWGAGFQDVQIHGAGMALPPLFHADDARTSRTVVSWRNRTSLRAGDIVCHRGVRTGYSCAQVLFPDFSPPGDLCAGPCPAAWVAVAGPGCKGGDSGGPVFIGSVAIGLMKGATTAEGTCQAYYFMSVDYLPPGWTVLHGAPPSPPASPVPVPADPTAQNGASDRRAEQARSG